MKLLALERSLRFFAPLGTVNQRSERLWKILILNRAKLVLRRLLAEFLPRRVDDSWKKFRDIECDTGFSMKYWDWKQPSCERWMKSEYGVEEYGWFLHSFCSLLEGICNIRETRRILRIVLFDRDWRGVIILSRPIFIRWIMQILLGIFSGAFCKYSNSILLGRKGETSGDGGKAWWKYVGT